MDYMNDDIDGLIDRLSMLDMDNASDEEAEAFEQEEELEEGVAPRKGPAFRLALLRECLERIQAKA